jgi:hypothetical protein
MDNLTITYIPYFPSFKESNMFVEVKLHILTLILFTLYNSYFPGRPNTIALILGFFLLRKLSIIVGDYNTYYIC